MRADYTKEAMIVVRVKGIDCQFTDIRIDRNTVPEGKFMYEVGADDDCGDEPARVKKGILVNFFGTLISDTELPLDEGVLWLEEGDFEWIDMEWRERNE